MKPSIKAQIIKWNRDRNSLRFDPNLEVKMLTEEANEFLMAETPADRLREYADFLFVWEGTKAKFYAQKIDRSGTLSMGFEHFGELERWAMNFGTLAENILYEDGTLELQDEALALVAQANEAKPVDATTGKVLKGLNYVDPIGNIRGLFVDLDSEQQEFVSVSSVQYVALNNAYSKLQALENAGVDNWEGYDDAMDGYRELTEDDWVKS